MAERVRAHHALAVKLRAGQRDERAESLAIFALLHAADGNAAAPRERDRPRVEWLGKLELHKRATFIRRDREG